MYELFYKRRPIDIAAQSRSSLRWFDFVNDCFLSVNVKFPVTGGMFVSCIVYPFGRSQGSTGILDDQSPAHIVQ